MNFFDAYEVPGTTTPPVNAQPQQSLNEEVEQVVGQLSRFWGGFRKQSQTAFESARKDFGQVVQQAQKELTKLATDAGPAASASGSGSAAPDPSTSATEQAASILAEAQEAASSEPSTSTTPTPTEKAAPSDTPASASDASASTSAPAAGTLFARLQASLPPALVQTVQNVQQNVQHAQLPETLRDTLQQAQAHARNASSLAGATDFAALRGAVAGELARVQGATGDYVQRSEALLREAGEFLREAVKVVPPEGGAAAEDPYAGLIWDGTDVWMLPTTASASGAGAGEDGKGKGKGKEREGSTGPGRPSVDTLRAVATRAESMLKQLRHDPAVIRADPHEDAAVREAFAAWLAAEVASEDRGLGTAAWRNRVERALADPVDGVALAATRDALVPEPLTEDEFWTRYFFRVHQVEREEARRKAIIQGTNENDEDFSWEDDDEESATSPTTKPAPAPPAPKEAAPPAGVTGHLTADAKSRVSTPGNMSPARQSSEDSYDVVSSQVSQSGKAETETIKGKKTDEESESEDDDEEEEDDDDDDDDDEEEEEEEGEGEGSEEDSDWE